MILKLKNCVYLSLIILTLLGLWVRFFRFGLIPESLYWDEAAIVADAKSVVLTGKDLHQQPWWQPIFLSYGDYKLPVYIWLASVVARISSSSTLIARLPALIVGVASMAMAGLLSIRLFAKGKGDKQIYFLTGTSLMAVSSWATHFSRVGFEAYLGQMLLTVAVWLFLSSKKCNWIFAQLVAGLAVYSYFSVRFVWPILFAMMIFYQAHQLGLLQIGDIFKQAGNRSRLLIAFKNWLCNSKKILPQIGSILVFIILMLPLITSDYYQPMLRFRYSAESVLNTTDWPAVSKELQAQGNVGVLGKVIYHRHWLLMRQLMTHVGKHLSIDFLFLSGDCNLRHGTGLSGLFLLPTLLPMCVGVYYLIKDKWTVGWLLFGWWLVSIVPAAVPMEVPHALRSLNALMPIVLIMSYGLYQFIVRSLSVSKSWWIKMSKLAILFGWMVSILFGYTRFAYHYFNIYPDSARNYWQTGYDQLAKIACDAHNQSQPLIISAHDQRFFLWVLANCTFSNHDYQEAEYRQAQLKKIGSLSFLSTQEVAASSPQSQQLWLTPTLIQSKDINFVTEVSSLAVGDEHYSLYQLGDSQL